MDMDRVAGALVGAALGDALGAGYEFARIPEGLLPGMIGGGLGPFAPGEWTDDTSLTWCVAEAATRFKDLRTEEALRAIATNFRVWYDSSPPDIGGTTSRAMSAGVDSMVDNAMSLFGRGTTRSVGTNGSLMRTAPVALAHLDDPVACVEAAMKVSALTHTTLDAQEACALWSLAIRHAVLEGEFDVLSGVKYLHPSRQLMWEKLLLECEVRSSSEFVRNGGAVVALQAAWASILQTPEAETHTYDALTAAIRVGVDTDTVASIAGALLGARWGLAALDSGHVEMLHGYPGGTWADLVQFSVDIVS